MYHRNSIVRRVCLTACLAVIFLAAATLAQAEMVLMNLGLDASPIVFSAYLNGYSEGSTVTATASGSLQVQMDVNFSNPSAPVVNSIAFVPVTYYSAPNATTSPPWPGGQVAYPGSLNIAPSTLNLSLPYTYEDDYGDVMTDYLATSVTGMQANLRTAAAIAVFDGAFSWNSGSLLDVVAGQVYAAELGGWVDDYSPRPKDGGPTSGRVVSDLEGGPRHLGLTTTDTLSTLALSLNGDGTYALSLHLHGLADGMIEPSPVAVELTSLFDLTLSAHWGTPTPEPGTIALLLSGGLLLGGWALRRR
jgi:hypothetical protein